MSTDLGSVSTWVSNKTEAAKALEAQEEVSREFSKPYVIKKRKVDCQNTVDKLIEYHFKDIKA